MAGKLARLVYRMLRCGTQYVGKGEATCRAPAPAVTDQAAQGESRQPGIATQRSSSSLISMSLWGDFSVPVLTAALLTSSLLAGSSAVAVRLICPRS
jgi:hypothetical protein